MENLNDILITAIKSLEKRIETLEGLVETLVENVDALNNPSGSDWFKKAMDND